jgi:hypothetical protein
MADSELYDSNSDLSSISDDGSSGGESLVGAEGPADNTLGPHEHTNNGSDEQTHAASQAAKAIEAAEERSPASPPDDAVAGTSHHPYASATRHADWEDQVPILDAGPAPPDYFAATAWRRSPPTNTVEALRGALPRRQDQHDPESQAGEDEATSPPRSVSEPGPTTDNVDSEEGHGVDPVDEAVLDETVPLLRRIIMNGSDAKQNKTRAVRRCTQRRWCVCCAVFIAVVMLVATLVAWMQGYKTSEIPKHAINHGNPALDHPKTAQCSFDSYSGYIDIQFWDAVSFSLTDDIDFFDDPELKKTIVTGNVEVVYVPQNSTVVRNSSIVVRVHMATVLPWKFEKVRYRKHEDNLIFRAPHLQRSSTANGLFHPVTSPPCLDVMLLIYVRDGTVLQQFETWLFYLNFIDHEGAIHKSTGPSTEMMPRKERLLVANETDIFTHRGKINISHWNSNHTRVGTWDGSISGTYPLYKSLELNSQNGNIDVWIDSTIENKEGIESTLWPSKYERELITRNGAGHAKIRVQPPLTYQHSSDLGYGSVAERKSAHTTSLPDTHELIEDGFMENLLSFHYSRSGTIYLHYPSRWSGNISALTYNGPISISGDEVEVTFDQEERGFRTVTAYKGTEDRVIHMENLYGEGTLYIGDEHG